MGKLWIVARGLVKENPVFVLMLGICPMLGTTSSAVNGMGMGLATMFVLICTNCTVSLLRNVIPSNVRIPAFIVLTASFGTIVQLLMEAYTPGLHATLGIFLPLIVVNCILLARLVAFASKNNVFDSFLDGVGMGLGFTLALVLLGAVREMLGNGSVFGLKFIGGDGMLIFILAPGGFIALGYLLVVFTKVTTRLKLNK